jgi:1-acyl-sn-glycerol-3-phosphate acyltransferase
LLAEIRITGRENVPAEGPYLVCINHISIYEPPFILAFWPVAPEAVGAVDIWERRGQATLAKLYGGIPVHRGQFDRRVLEAMILVLKSGRPLVIAPEGGRSHQPGMRRALPGAAYVIEKVPVPVIPVGMVGTTEDFMRRALHRDRALKRERPILEMRIGQPLYLPTIAERGQQRRVALQENADLIMRAIAALLPAEYRGVYAE